MSAGRVQSVALRMVVERERERINYLAGWWDIQKYRCPTVRLVSDQSIEDYPNHKVIGAKLKYWKGRKIAEGSSFNDMES